MAYTDIETLLRSTVGSNLRNFGVYPPASTFTGMQTEAMNKAIPGFSGLTQSASDIVGTLLKGLPSASPTQRANAYFGTASGMPGSDFVRNRGFDLYGEEAEKYKQRGIDNLLAMLQGYSGTITPTTGQALQSDQFNQEIAMQKAQQALQNALVQQKTEPKKREYSKTIYSTMGTPMNTACKFFM